MNRSMKKIIWILIAVIAVALVWVKTSTDKEVSTNEPTKIGALLILSGDFSAYGERSRKAVEIAVEKHNQENPDNPVEVIFEDTHGDPKQALSAYEKLVKVDNVDVIVGPLLQVEMAAILPKLKQDNIPMFSVAPVTKELRENTSNPLVVWPDPTLEAGQMAKYVFDQGIRTVGILGTQDSWENEVSSAFADKFTALGGKVIAREIVLPTDDDVRLAVTKVISKSPEAIFLGTYYKFYPFVKTLSEQRYKGKLYSIEIDSYLASESGSLSNGLRFISPDFYTDEFINEFKSRYSESPTLPAGQTHDAMQILLSFVKEGKSGNELLKAMNDLEKFEGVSGTIKFTEDHRATFPLSIFELQNGEIIRITN
jgi:branched-chain amino acid transport system substrate-binding protein